MKKLRMMTLLLFFFGPFTLWSNCLKKDIDQFLQKNEVLLECKTLSENRLLLLFSTPQSGIGVLLASVQNDKVMTLSRQSGFGEIALQTNNFQIKSAAPADYLILIPLKKQILLFIQTTAESSPDWLFARLIDGEKLVNIEFDIGSRLIDLISHKSNESFEWLSKSQILEQRIEKKRWSFDALQNKFRLTKP